MRCQVIGSGFAGLSAASYLARDGHEVDVYEKNSMAGGRARMFQAEGFTFDMGPSWYWMPDVFEKYYAAFDRKVPDFYDLRELDPGFRMYFGEGDVVDLPAGEDAILELFEQIETGAADKLRAFMKEAKEKYEVSMNDLVYKPGLSIMEFIQPKVMSAALRMNLFGSFGKYVRRLFKDPRLIALMDFPVLFLGASSANTPALYSLMNYAGLYMGTWYPMGGMHEIIKGFVKIAVEQGVRIHTDSPVDSIHVDKGRAHSLSVKGKKIPVETLVATGDYHHMESLLPASARNYSESYWDKRVMSPSSLLFYLGVDKKLTGLQHHTLFFDESLEHHSTQIYDDPQWPDAPLFYACCPSMIDPSVAPEGKENLFLLVPVAAGLEDTEAVREKYYDMIMSRLERLTGQKIREHVIYKRSYAHTDFQEDYHAYKGNAYGLANTLRQTAVLKPTLINKSLSNMLYAGQLTVPGPGVPPSIISGEMAAQYIKKNHARLAKGQ